MALAVAVVQSGGGARELGAVTACSVLAMLACTLFGGVWADRMQPRRAMVLADMGRFVAVACMAIMFGAGAHSSVVLSLLAAMSSAAGSLFFPAMTALKPMLADGDRLRSANATLGLLQSSSSVIGPALGGVVVGLFGAPAGFSINAVSFLASAVSVWMISARVDRTPGHGMVSAIREGWAEIRQRDWLLSGILAATPFHVANGAVLVLAQVIAIRDVGGAGAAGTIAAAEGLGGVLGGLAAMHFRPDHQLRAGFIALAPMTLWVISYVGPAGLASIVAGAVVGYAGLTFFSVAWETAVQTHVPHQALARVASWDMLTSFIGMPIGSAVAGPLADMVGTDTLLIACASVMLLSGSAPLLVRGLWNLTHATTSTLAPVPGT